MAPVNSRRRGETGSYEAAEPTGLTKHRPDPGTCRIALVLMTDLLAYPNVARVFLDTRSAVLPRRLDGGLWVPRRRGGAPHKESNHCDQHATG
jgi:hypothetical protein